MDDTMAESYLDIAAASIKEHEGFRKHAYRDHLGHWTIGHGTLIDRNFWIPATHAEVLFAERFNIAEQDAKNFIGPVVFKKLSPARQAVLIEMAYQMGGTRLNKFHKTYRLIREEKHAEAAENMLQSKWASQTPKRAHALAERFRIG